MMIVLVFVVMVVALCLELMFHDALVVVLVLNVRLYLWLWLAVIGLVFEFVLCCSFLVAVCSIVSCGRNGCSKYTVVCRLC